MRPHTIILLTLLTSLILCSCNRDLQVGDILFQELSTNELDDAIEQVTGGDYSHCAMVVNVGENVLVAEAIGDSVQVIAIEDFIARSGEHSICAKRVKSHYRSLIPSAIEFVLAQRGRPYDDYYLLDNGKWYCSELITEAFNYSAKEEVFHYQAMTFKNPDTGDFSQTWIDHYSTLGIPIPEGKLGNNPNSLFAEQNLSPQKIKLY